MPTESNTVSSVDRSNPLPLYSQLAGVLRTRIKTGQFPVGSRIPGEQQLIQSYQVSQPTVRQALATLVREGLVVRERGRGTFVRRAGASQQRTDRRLTHAITVLMPFAPGTFFAPLVEAIEDVFSGRGFRMMLANNRDDRQVETACLRELAAHKHDGLLWVIPIGGPDPSTLRQLRESETRMVMVDRRPPGEAVDFVASDHFAGSQQAVNHLIEIGCKRIAYFRDSGVNSSCEERFHGYRQALERHGLGYDESLVFTSKKWYRQAGFDCATQMLNSPVTADGVFCMNTPLAHGVMEALKHANVRVPEDMALVTFDDDLEASSATPTLTVIRQDFKGIGKTAAQLLLRCILADPPGPPEDLRIPAQLIIRQSTTRNRIGQHPQLLTELENSKAASKEVQSMT